MSDQFKSVKTSPWIVFVIAPEPVVLYFSKTLEKRASEAGILEEEVRETTTVMSKEMDG